MSWVEKYRPEKPEDFVGNETIVKSVFGDLDAEMDGKELCPHLLFIGKEGIGKTSLINVIRKKYPFTEVKEINASLKARIDILRTDLDKYARLSPIRGGKMRKLLILEELDNSSDDFQHAFRRFMETYGKRILVVGTANYENQILPPVLSRFSKHGFKPVSDDILRALIVKIAGKEGRPASDDFLNAIVKLSKGKPRDAIQLLQSSREGNVAEVEFFSKIKELTKSIRDTPLFAFKDMRKLVNEVPNARMIVEGLLDATVLNENAPDAIKLKAARVLGKYDFRLVEGGSSEVQMAALVADLAKVFKQVVKKDG